MIPYSHDVIEEEDIRAVEEVLRGGPITRGSVTARLEVEVTEYIGVKHAVAFSSGTAALHAAIAILDPTDVWTPTLTFCAVANAAHFSHARLRCLDVDESTLHSRTPWPWAEHGRHVFVPMDYAGLPYLYEDTTPFKRKTWAVVEDACHALGGTYPAREGIYLDNKRVGSLADMTAFSLHPGKQVCAGEGGLVVTDIDEYDELLRIFRNNGQRPGNRYSGPGLNYHMDEMSAALALSQFRRLEANLIRRRAIATRYFSHWAKDERIQLPSWAKGHAWHLFPIRVDAAIRDKFRKALAECEVGTQTHYSPLHLQPALTGHPPLPVAEREVQRLVSIPMYHGLTDAEVDHVIASVDYALAMLTQDFVVRGP